MSTHDVEALRGRLTAMERRFRVLSATWVAITLMAAILGIGAQRVASQTQTLDIRELHIVDQQGRQRITMGLSSRGNPVIWFYDEAGKNRFYLGLATGSGSPTPQVLMIDEHDTNRMYMGWSDSAPEKPMITVYDESGKEIWRAP